MDPPLQSTEWLDVTTEEDGSSSLATTSATSGGSGGLSAATSASPQTALDLLGLRNADQRDEIEIVVNVYTAGSKVLLARDRFHCVMLRCTLTVDVMKSVLRATVTLVVPALYPLPGHPLGIRVTSTSGSKDFVAALTKQLTDEADAFAALGMPAMMMLFGKAAESIQSMPRAMWSADYCCCVVCNARKVKNGEEKFPQPALRSEPGKAGAATDAGSSPSSSLITGGGGGGGWRCLVCGSPALHLPAVRAYAPEEVDDHPCAMCFCGDSSMVHLHCGDVVCFACFVRMCEIAIGSKDLTAARPGGGGGALATTPSGARPRGKFMTGPTPVVRAFMGVQCPNHKKSPAAVIADPGLIKLLPTRSYNRFNFFALEKAMEPLPCVMFCPLPGCCGYCWISTQYGRFCLCPFCGDTFCAKCAQPYLSCTCKDTDMLAREVWELTEKDVSIMLDLPGLWQEEADKAWKRAKPAAVAPAGDARSKDDSSFTLLVTVRNFQSTMQVPSVGWHECLHQKLVAACNDLVPYHSVHRRRRDDLFAAVFHGYILDVSKSLKEQLVYTGAIVFLVEYFPFDAYTRDLILMKLLEHSMQARVGLVDVAKKRCPVCEKPVVHYLGHGCHMIAGCHAGPPEWCFVCGAKAEMHRCLKGCSLFCKFEHVTGRDGRPTVVPIDCDCPLCPECKPMRPCEQCCGCPMCNLVTR